MVRFVRGMVKYGNGNNDREGCCRRRVALVEEDREVPKQSVEVKVNGGGGKRSLVVGFDFDEGISMFFLSPLEFFSETCF